MKVLQQATPWIATALMIALWDVSVRVFEIPPYLVPSPHAVVDEMWRHREVLFYASVWTSVEIWLGFLLAVLLGFGLAVPIAYSRMLERAVLPVIVIQQVVPKVAVAPLFLIWLGYGLSPKILVAALIAFFPILMNTIKGLRTVDAELAQWVGTLGATRLQIFGKLALPWALPYIFAAMKVAITFAVVGAVVGEFVGSDRGLGYVILQSTNVLDTKLTFAALVVLSLVGVLSYWMILIAERLLVPWESEAEAESATV